MASKLCSRCGHVGEPSRHTKGHFLVEVILWLCFIIPGLIYSVWRVASKIDVCAKCGEQSLLPVDSPMARKFLKENPEITVVPDIRPPSAAAVNAGRALGRLFAKK